MKNDLQKESLKQLLLAQKAQLLDKIEQERGGLKSRAEAAAELAPAEQSHAQNITERDTTFALQEHALEELEATELALTRIAQGTYGLCLVWESFCLFILFLLLLNEHFLGVVISAYAMGLQNAMVTLIGMSEAPCLMHMCC